MKLRYGFEGSQTNLMNRASVPSLDECLNELFHEEQCLLTQTNMEQWNLSPFLWCMQYKADLKDETWVLSNVFVA